MGFGQPLDHAMAQQSGAEAIGHRRSVGPPRPAAVGNQRALPEAASFTAFGLPGIEREEHIHGVAPGIGIAPEQPVVSALRARLPPQRRTVIDTMPARHCWEHNAARQRCIEPVGGIGPALPDQRQRQQAASHPGRRQPHRREPGKQRRRSDLFGIDHCRAGRAVKKPPANRQHRRDHESEKEPAVDQMVDPASPLGTNELRGVNCTPGPHPVGQHRHNQANEHEQHAPRPAAEALVADQRPQRDHRNQELDARTGFGHLEQAGGRINEHPVDRRRHTRQLHQDNRQARGHQLELRHQFVTERNQESHVGQRKSQTNAGPRTEQRQHGRAQHRHRPGLPDQRKAGERAQHPQQNSRCEQYQPGPPPGGHQALQRWPALANLPGQDRRDQQHMVIGRAVPPLFGHLAPVGAEDEQQHHEHSGKRRQRPTPGHRKVDLRR